MGRKNKETDWTSYYKGKRSFFSTYTQQFTEKIIADTISKYCKKDIEILECGGGGSCFANNLIKKSDVSRYDVIDNNKYAVDLFNEMELHVLHEGICANLLEKQYIEKQYDFVYSIGLIEHFEEEDREIVINAHIRYCKPGGIVLISFPTPTYKYRITRKIMELIGVWQFWDEHPLAERQVRPFMECYGEIVESFINKKLPLSQRVIILKKR